MAMSETIFEELTLLGKSLAVGVALMMFYDGLRLFRALAAHGALWTGMEDFVYWAVCSLVTFLLLLHLNEGVVRWYAVGGVLVGMLVYNMTISRIYLHLLKKAKKYFTIKKMPRRKREEVISDGAKERQRSPAGEPGGAVRAGERAPAAGDCAGKQTSAAGDCVGKQTSAAGDDAGKWPPAG